MPDQYPNEPFEAEFVSQLTSHQGVLHAFLVSLMPGNSEIDDVLQKTNLVLWEKRRDFEPGSKFKSWALSVAYWEARAWMTNRKRGDWLVVDDALVRKIIERIEVQPMQSASASVSALRNCLSKLKDNDRTLVLTHHQQDKSLAECSRILDRSAKSLSVSLVRIRANLRRCIQSEISIEEVQA